MHNMINISFKDIDDCERKYMMCKTVDKVGNEKNIEIIYTQWANNRTIFEIR